MPVASGTRRVAIAGNPNTGKTTLFNRLTGRRAKVGNYPGVTVDRHYGPLTLERAGEVELVDVPGTYSLAARSPEEELAIRAVAGLHPLEEPDAVIAVVDATQLVRNLYLVLQLIELDLSVVVALNMLDEVEKTGQEIDPAALERELGCPVVPLVALKGQGIEELKRAVDDVLENPERGRPGWRWRPDDLALAADVEAVAARVPDAWADGSDARRRAFALWALLSLEEHDELTDVPVELREVVDARRSVAEEESRPIEEAIIRGRYDWIDERAERFLRSSREQVTWTDRIDRVLLHPAFGFAIFLALMTLVFQSLFAWADPMITGIEGLFGALGGAVEGVLPEGVVRDFLVQGLIGGVGSVIVFLPQILLLFFFIGLMEDTGYMSRVAYLMDRIMKALGLHGRAFVPMLSGFACAVPAIMATRTMERRRDRLLTMMVIPLMTCSARLPVYGLLIAALYPPNVSKPLAQGLLLAAMYLFSTLIALVAAWVLGRTVLRGPHIPLLLEMPPYRRPHWPSVLRMMWQKSMIFVKEAGTIILACTVAMWFLLSFPKNDTVVESFAEARSAATAELVQGAELDARLAQLDSEESGELLRTSYGGRMGRALEPALEPMGFDWKIGVGLIGAFAAREVFISTMAVVYGLDEGVDEASTALRDRVRDQRWPDGRKVFTPVTCLALMVFFALACQCMSTLAAVRRETSSWRWPVFLFVYTGLLAWSTSVLVYQGGRILGFE